MIFQKQFWSAEVKIQNFKREDAKDLKLNKKGGGSGNLTKKYFATGRAVGKCAQLELTCALLRAHFSANFGQITLKGLRSTSKNKVHLGNLKFGQVEISKRRRWTLILEIDPRSFRIFCSKLAEKWSLKWPKVNSNCPTCCRVIFCQVTIPPPPTLNTTPNISIKQKIPFFAVVQNKALGLTTGIGKTRPNWAR